MTLWRSDKFLLMLSVYIQGCTADMGHIFSKLFDILLGCKFSSFLCPISESLIYWCGVNLLFQQIPYPIRWIHNILRHQWQALHGGKELISPDPVHCITVWFCVDLDITAYQTAYAHSIGMRYYARHTLTVMIRMYVWLGRCVSFAWWQCAHTEGKGVLKAVGYSDQYRP